MTTVTRDTPCCGGDNVSAGSEPEDALSEGSLHTGFKVGFVGIHISFDTRNQALWVLATQQPLG